MGAATTYWVKDRYTGAVYEVNAVTFAEATEAVATGRAIAIRIDEPEERREDRYIEVYQEWRR